MYGADLEVDIPYNWMTFFMEDDARLEEVAQLYSSGKLMSGDVKGELITILQKLVADHQVDILFFLIKIGKEKINY